MIPTAHRHPIIKWPGGKRQLVGVIAKRLGPISGRYFEPFLGGGALFFSLLPQRAHLSDLNEDLIGFYRQVKDNPELVIEALREFVGEKECYYLERDKDLRVDSPEAAARFLYLVSYAFNGIYRQNLKGKFNVPFGHRTRVNWPPVEDIRRASIQLKDAELSAGDFAQAVAFAAAGDSIYFDPPYTVAHNNNGFVKYNARIFSWKDQERLAELAHSLVVRGCRVFVSNADHDSLRKLYADFSEDIISRSSVISGVVTGRRSVTESLFVGGV